MTSTSFELSFVLKNVVFNVDFEDDVFDDSIKSAILKELDNLYNGIFIDKSYVECTGNKRSDVFMNETGWNSLRDLIIDTEYCKYLNPNAQGVISDAFITMARCYAYECVSKITPEVKSIAISVRSDCQFEVTICKDTSSYWKQYPGKWQTWKFDEDGNPHSSQSK